MNFFVRVIVLLKFLPVNHWLHFWVPLSHFNTHCAFLLVKVGQCGSRESLWLLKRSSGAECKLLRLFRILALSGCWRSLLNLGWNVSVFGRHLFFNFTRLMRKKEVYFWVGSRSPFFVSPLQLSLVFSIDLVPCGSLLAVLELAFGLCDHWQG